MGTTTTSFTQTSISNTLKNVWVNLLELEVARVSPLLALFNKDTEWVGDALVTTIPYGNGPGRSADYATAVANADYSLNAKFVQGDVSDYGIFNVLNKALKASKNNKGAVVKHLYRESRGKMIELMSSFARALHGDGSGVIGRRASISSNVVTLTNRWDIVNFSVNDTVIAATATSGGTLRAGSAKVIALNPDAGSGTSTITLDNAATITGFADNDYLFVAGDRGAKITGLEGWNPATAPTTGDSFLGQDRSPNPWALAGLRFDGSTMQAKEAISLGLSISGMVKGRPTYGITDFGQFENLKVELGNQREYVDVKARNVDVGFKGIEFHAPNGGSPVVILPDTHSPPNLCRLLDPDDWTIHSRDALPHLKDEDGLTMVRNTTTSDSYQGQWLYYANLNPDAGKLLNTVRVTLAALRA
jgi:hypothetical protein